MTIQVDGHTFVNFKSEEMICRTCGYVIWRCDTPEEAKNAIVQISGENSVHTNQCPGSWHGWSKYQ